MGSNPSPTSALWRKSSYSGTTGGNCVECAPLGNVAWRKSTYSGDTGGDCIECAPLGSASWQKSSHSGASQSQCVEVAAQPCRIAVRDSKDPGRGSFTVAPAAFAVFTEAASRGALNPA
ncbi:DUF397 domain-containing protein [Streptomyces sp. NPDC005953]|uniref:DUF397 domain-containing protein n=1 Tax=Streptomyces sp. NPDC005953 TaxID=3156719 RepID=UPI0033F61C41